MCDPFFGFSGGNNNYIVTRKFNRRRAVCYRQIDKEISSNIIRCASVHHMDENLYFVPKTIDVFILYQKTRDILKIFIDK